MHGGAGAALVGVVVAAVRQALHTIHGLGDGVCCYVEQVNANLVEAGALGSMLWCFADYVPELWDSPPCLEAHHERFFGLVRPDGSLKPHAAVIRRLAQTRPTVQVPTNSVILDISPDEYYQSPTAHARRLYERYLEQVDV